MESFPWWNEAQRKLFDEGNSFVDENIGKTEELIWKREYPWELIKEMGKRGWFGSIISEKYGGRRGELGITGCCIINEGLGRSGILVFPYFMTMCGGTHQIENFAIEEKKREWLPKIARGEMLGSVCLIEPYTGLMLPP